MVILYMTKHTTSPFNQKLESFQYNASQVITGTMRGTSREKLRQELDQEPLQLRIERALLFH